MAEKMDAWQTVETPHVLAIALLARQMARWDLAAVERETREKAALLYGTALPWTPYVEDVAWRSITVACMRVDEPKLDQAIKRRGSFRSAMASLASTGFALRTSSQQHRSLTAQLVGELSGAGLCRFCSGLIPGPMAALRGAPWPRGEPGPIQLGRAAAGLNPTSGLKPQLNHHYTRAPRKAPDTATRRGVPVDTARTRLSISAAGPPPSRAPASVRRPCG
jgi:hypothetical protein